MSAHSAPCSRRECLMGMAMLALGTHSTPLMATPAAMEEAIKAFTGGAKLLSGRVELEVPPLSENGNAVPLSVRVDSPMSAEDHVTSIAVFNEKNPHAQVATVHLGPRAGLAAFSTRIRLADSQSIVAIARMNDGRYFFARADILVTLAACLEGG